MLVAKADKLAMQASRPVIGASGKQLMPGREGGGKGAAVPIMHSGSAARTIGW